ncbi:hypothetical protein Enr13x_34290 [Stieleria neptunia]|uniref:Uncharacterized protein n=1 Tax=Stieleria neptunia TaxID=2527979 RepID=A0A518HRU6_9BACT|nr:hypothetical protein Enr13x_34290 [Stieleria neptunia]
MRCKLMHRLLWNIQTFSSRVCLAAIGFPGRVASAEKDTQMEGLERMLA